MSSERRMRILSRLFPDDDADLGATRLCEVCAEITNMSGAGIMVMSGEVPQSSAGSSDQVSARLEELQYTVGEGPCVDAARLGGPVSEPDLADPATPRWLGFTPSAVKAGARAVFGFPLHVGLIRLGALDLYRDRPGPLSADQHADALVMANVAAEALLFMQANAPPGALAAELANEVSVRAVVHQATGMVAAQLDVSVSEALIRLRAYAFSHDRRLMEIAEEVVGRRLHFDAESADAEPTDDGRAP